MNKRVLIPFLAFGALVLIISLACGPTPTATTAPPTQADQATQAPLDTTSDEAPAYFTEEFNTDTLPEWSYFLTYGEEEDVTLETGNDKMTIEIEHTNTAFYLMYDPYTYTDVRLDARVTNRGQNTNNISFICRYDGTDWFELSVSNGGLWSLYYGKWNDSGIGASYGEMAAGGADHIRTGKETNDFTFTCIGNELTFYVNGVEEGSHIDKDYALTEGQVGINVTSFDTYPIILDFDYFQVSEP